jgi:hypothetical protein
MDPQRQMLMKQMLAAGGIVDPALLTSAFAIT